MKNTMTWRCIVGMIRGLRPQYPRSQAGVFITMGRGQSVSKYCQIILLDLDKQYQNNYIIILFLTPPGNGYKDCV